MVFKWLDQLTWLQGTDSRWNWWRALLCQTSCLTTWQTESLVTSSAGFSRAQTAQFTALQLFKMFHLIMNLWSEPFSCLFIPDRNKHWKLSRNPDHFSFSFLLGSQYIKLGERSRGGGHNSISTILLIVSFMWVHVCVCTVCVCLCPWITAGSLNPCSELLLWLFLTPACFIFYCTLITWVLCLIR